MDKIKSIQQKIGKMKKDTEGYNYKYFDINQLLEKLTPLLHEEGLTLIQPLTNINGRPAIQTIVYELRKKEVNNGTKDVAIVYDEQRLIDFVVTLPDLIKPQEMGSCITYYRRYSLQSLFALEAEDDDASSTNEKTVKYGSTPKQKTKDYQASNKASYEAGDEPF